MPQAMPLNWLNLYIMFILIFIMIVIKMYFNQNKMPKKLFLMINKKMNWKW